MIHVLLIDDEEDALDLLEILLGKMEHIRIVGRFVNPLQAIEALNQLAVDEIDAVFLDIQMPGMRGTEIARVIRQTRPRLPIIFTTAYAEYAVEAFEINSTDYLLKPFTLDRLQIAVARIKPDVSKTKDHVRSSESKFPYIQYFGGFHIRLSDAEDRILTWKTKKEKELCAFLLHHEGLPVNTATIIEALWPEYDLNNAKTYLYTCLSYLRKSLAERNIPMKIQRVDKGFVVEMSDVSSDVVEFEKLLSYFSTKKQLDERMYDKLCNLYQGPYMATCDFHWVDVKRMELHTAYVQALRKWHQYFYRSGNITLALHSIQRLLMVAPDSEVDGRQLMAIHLEIGNRNEALRVYKQLEQAVRDELGVALEEATLRLYRQASNT